MDGYADADADAGAWLLGTWRSNKEKTLATYRWSSPEGRESFARDLGKLTHRYTPKRLRTSIDGQVVDTMPYRVVWKNGNEIFLVYGTGRSEGGTHMRFLSPTEFSVPMGMHGVEYYSKVLGES